MSIEIFFFTLAAYLISAIPFGVVVSRLVGKTDVRKHGSGNIGATNVSRVLGKKWGIFVLFLDALKGYIVVKAALTLKSTEVDALFFANCMAVLALVGHCYPVYLKFKGGKGVATGLGVTLALSPPAIGVAMLVFFVSIFATRIVSVASLLSALSLPIFSLFVANPLDSRFAAMLAALVWWKHKENILRIWARKEPRFF